MDGERIPLSVGERESEALWHPVPGALAVAVIAPGAGNTMRAPYFDGIVAGFADHGVAALRFDFVYAHEGRKSPDAAPLLFAAWRAALSEAVRLADGLPLAATGKSMGGRYASMLAAEEGPAFAASALVYFGYPLHAPKTPDALRSEHLSNIIVPMLFIQGTRDAFARPDRLEPVLASLGDRARVEWIEGGDHSHRVRGERRSDEEIGRDLGGMAAAFVRDVIGKA
jgi:predicted alpha/beta-hydrolase family hydrolase